MSDHFQLNLGSLRSEMNLTLHTHHASRIWHGRKAADGKNGILGLTGFVLIMNKMKRGAEQDDPFSDWWMIKIEERLEAGESEMRQIQEQLDGVMAKLPDTVSIGNNLNVSPINVPLYVNSQLGFKAVYLVAEYDELARRLLLAHHTALIGRHALEQWIDQGAHILRSIFGLAQQYKFSGATRDDIAAQNARGREAMERFGPIPQDILEGTRRSQFAPLIARRSVDGHEAESGAQSAEAGSSGSED